MPPPRLLRTTGKAHRLHAFSPAADSEVTPPQRSRARKAFAEGKTADSAAKYRVPKMESVSDEKLKVEAATHVSNEAQIMGQSASQTITSSHRTLTPLDYSVGFFIHCHDTDALPHNPFFHFYV